jgi:hypothetical protein
MTTTPLIGTVDGIHSLDDDHVALPGRVVTALIPGWALTDGDTVWRADARGGWVEAAHLDAPWPGTCLAPLGDAVLVGTQQAHLLRLDAEAQAVVGGFDALPAREEWYTPWGGPPDVRSLATGDGVAYVNVHVGGIARSDDGATTWSATGLDIHADVHQVVTAGGRVLAAAGDGGLVWSDDAGASWHHDTRGLHATYARAVAVGGDTVLLTASTGPRTQSAAIYRRSLDGRTFERCREGLPERFADNIDTGCLAARGDAVAFGTADGRAFVSADAGATWEQAAAGLPRVTAVAL